MLCFVVVMQSFIMNSHEVFIHIHQGCFAGTGAIVRLPQCQWSKPDGYGKISERITTTKHSKAKTVCIFLEIYCNNSDVIAMSNWQMTIGFRLGIQWRSDTIRNNHKNAWFEKQWMSYGSLIQHTHKNIYFANLMFRARRSAMKN